MLSAIMKVERRRGGRAPLEIKSVEDARQFVKLVHARNVENHAGVKAWRLAKQSAGLLLLVVAYLVFYLITKVSDAISLL